MGDWYQVVKTIKGNKYRYLQQTWREGGVVRTRNRYLGRVDTSASNNKAGIPGTATQTTSSLSSPVLQSASDFGAAMLKQFDAPQWGRDAGEQLLGSAVSGGSAPGRSGTSRRSRSRFDFGRDVSYDETAKRRFHLHARRQLRELAAELGLGSGDYTLRSNKAGVAVSGEITLHADHLYVQVNQSVMSADRGILFRRCQGRADDTGGANNFASLDLLNDPAELAQEIRRVCLKSGVSPVTSPTDTQTPQVLMPSLEEGQGIFAGRQVLRFRPAQSGKDAGEQLPGSAVSAVTTTERTGSPAFSPGGDEPSAPLHLPKHRRIIDAYPRDFLGMNMAYLEEQAEEKGYNLYDALIKRVDSTADIHEKVAAIHGILDDILDIPHEETTVHERSVPSTTPSQHPASAGTGGAKGSQAEAGSRSYSPRDVQAEITNKIIAAIESGRDTGTFQMPWQAIGSVGLPVNAVTKQPYHGANVLFLSLEAQEHKWPNRWASFQQWKERGARVRKGEQGVPVAFYSPVQIQEIEEDADGKKKTIVKTIPVFRYSTVFNIAQVDNPPVDTPAPREPVNPIARVEQFVSATKAQIRYGGDRAYYSPDLDHIQMPVREAFTGTKTSSPTEAFYGVLLHELCHWTGGKSRLNRENHNRFGDEAYAAEELIAEIGAAFSCAKLGITPELRADHVQYVASWLKILKEDKRAIFTAAAAATRAVAYLEALQSPEEVTTTAKSGNDKNLPETQTAKDGEGTTHYQPEQKNSDGQDPNRRAEGSAARSLPSWASTSKKQPTSGGDFLLSKLHLRPEPFDFRFPVANNPQAKKLFHARAKQQLQKLAAALGLPKGSYTVRSNRGDAGISGEVILQSKGFYVEVSQTAFFPDNALAFRWCRDRHDTVGGGETSFVSIDLLNDPAELARQIKQEFRLLGIS